MGRDAEMLAKSMPGEIELAGLIKDAADCLDGNQDNYCSWSMANAAAASVGRRLKTVALRSASPKQADSSGREELVKLAETFETLRENYMSHFLVADCRAFEEFCFNNSSEISAALHLALTLSTPVTPAEVKS